MNNITARNIEIARSNKSGFSYVVQWNPLAPDKAPRSIDAIDYGDAVSIAQECRHDDHGYVEYYGDPVEIGAMAMGEKIACHSLTGKELRALSRGESLDAIEIDFN